MEILGKYLTDREMELNRILKKRPRSYTKSTFHVFRVEIKKLNALFSLIDECFKGFKRRKTFHPFRLIFRQAGRVRAIQIEESILKKLAGDQPLPHYIKQLRICRLEEQRIFYRLLKALPPGRLDEEYCEIRPLLGMIDERQAGNYLNKSSKRIGKFIKNLDYSEIQMHTLRKMVKSHGYLKDCISPAGDHPEKEKNPDLANLLGQWHDRILIINHLESALAENPADPSEQAWLEQAKSTLSAELEILTEQIRAATQAEKLTEIREIEMID